MISSDGRWSCKFRKSPTVPDQLQPKKVRGEANPIANPIVLELGEHKTLIRSIQKIGKGGVGGLMLPQRGESDG